MKKTITNFQQVYKNYHADVYRFACWICGNKDDAKDITSETFLRAWSATSQLNATTLKGYLLTIARNIYLQNIRKNRNQVEIDDGIIDTYPGVSEVTEQKIQLEMVLKSLQSLGELDRSILVMKAYEGLSYKEISNLLGLPISILKVKVHRARIKLITINQNGEYK